MAYDPQNIFAKILRGEAPAYKVYEDAHTFAFLDIMPQARGHTLVIPKAEGENLFDTPPEALAETIKATRKIAAAVKEVTEAPGVMIAQLNGPAAGQTVFHLHFHIIPRWEGVDMKLHARDMAPADELEPLQKAIAAALA